MEIFRCVRHILTNGVFKKTSEWQLAKDVALDSGTDVETYLASMSANNKITEVQIVSSLPIDAADHPTTLYLIKG